MSAAEQNSIGELPQVVPMFSYAQAAKGKSPTVPSLNSSGKALSETTGIDTRRTSISEPKSTTTSSDRPIAKRTVSESRKSLGGDLKTRVELNDVPSRADEAGHATTSPSPRSQQEGHDILVASTPSSPGFGTASTSTLLKEDDMFSTPNGSSDSTWEKQSQTSQNGMKTGEKVDGEKEQSAGTTWDEEPLLPASFKEAPPPAINFWKQRREAQDAKTKASKNATSAPKSKPATSDAMYGNSNGTTSKNLDSGVDSRKQDSKRKAKNSVGTTEERAGLGASKDGHKSGEGRAKFGEDGNVLLGFGLSYSLTE